MFELQVGAGIGGELLVVDAERAVRLMREASHGLGEMPIPACWSSWAMLLVARRLHFRRVIGSPVVICFSRISISATIWSFFFDGPSPAAGQRTNGAAFRPASCKRGRWPLSVRGGRLPGWSHQRPWGQLAWCVRGAEAETRNLLARDLSCWKSWSNAPYTSTSKLWAS